MRIPLSNKEPKVNIVECWRKRIRPKIKTPIIVEGRDERGNLIREDMVLEKPLWKWLYDKIKNVFKHNIPGGLK